MIAFSVNLKKVFTLNSSSKVEIYLIEKLSFFAFDKSALASLLFGSKDNVNSRVVFK
jgi:hypothetical protein